MNASGPVKNGLHRCRCFSVFIIGRGNGSNGQEEVVAKCAVRPVNGPAGRTVNRVGCRIVLAAQGRNAKALIVLLKAELIAAKAALAKLPAGPRAVVA